MPQADGSRKGCCYFAYNNVLYVAKDRHITPIPGAAEGTTRRDAGKGVPCSFPLWLAGPAGGGLSRAFLRSSGKRGLAIQNEHVLVMRHRSERVILFLEPNKLGFQVANTLLKTAHF
jgi:hypothetical protein